MRALSLTEELVSRVERTEPDPGPDPGTTDHTREEFQALAVAFLVLRPPGDLWLFAYGSLIWNPEFDHEESRRALARGWHRSFCLTLTRWRGTREVPALMLALDRGGSCAGLVYRLRETAPVTQVTKLLERELDGNPPTNVPRWIRVTTPSGPVTAMAFVADPKGRAYAGRLQLEQVAHIVARAAGHWGSSAQYAWRTIAKLEEFGIRDSSLWRLQTLVAAEILKITSK
jgi:cation transport protein ChaC